MFLKPAGILYKFIYVKRSQRYFRSKASPRKNLEQHNASKEYPQWSKQCSGHSNGPVL
jgi:hypothetical protein